MQTNHAPVDNTQSSIPTRVYHSLSQLSALVFQWIQTVYCNPIHAALKSTNISRCNIIYHHDHANQSCSRRQHTKFNPYKGVSLIISIKCIGIPLDSNSILQPNPCGYEVYKHFKMQHYLSS